jgi:hypothetical protein
MLREAEWPIHVLLTEGARQILEGRPLDLRIPLEPEPDWFWPAMPRSALAMHKRIEETARFNIDPERYVRRHARRILNRERDRDREWDHERDRTAETDVPVAVPVVVPLAVPVRIPVGLCIRAPPLAAPDSRKLQPSPTCRHARRERDPAPIACTPPNRYP